MADTDSTQTGSTTTADQTSSTDQTSVGSASTQPAHATQVETGNAEDQGNSGSSDGSNGTDSGDAGRRRPGRAERRIAELTAQLKQQDNLKVENDRLRAMLDNPLAANQLKLPDRSGQDSVTPEQYTQDVVSVADQIVKARLGQILGENNQLLSKQQQTDRAYRELMDAPKKYPELNPDHESYDPQLESYLAKQFELSFKADPTYSFNDLTDATMALRGGTAKPSPIAASKPASPSQGAIKPHAQKSAHKPIEQMSSDEYLAHIRGNGGA